MKKISCFQTWRTVPILARESLGFSVHSKLKLRLLEIPYRLFFLSLWMSGGLQNCHGRLQRGHILQSTVRLQQLGFGHIARVQDRVLHRPQVFLHIIQPSLHARQLSLKERNAQIKIFRRYNFFKIFFYSHSFVYCTINIFLKKNGHYHS